MRTRMRMIMRRCIYYKKLTEYMRKHKKKRDINNITDIFIDKNMKLSVRKHIYR